MQATELVSELRNTPVNQSLFGFDEIKMRKQTVAGYSCRSMIDSSRMHYFISNMVVNWAKIN